MLGSMAMMDYYLTSPSTRREWIEIAPDRRQRPNQCCLPPHGGSGLKFYSAMCRTGIPRLPPHGGSGLKLHSVKRLSVDDSRLPPHGGSGLKSVAVYSIFQHIQSPSTRREWIEIRMAKFLYK